MVRFGWSERRSLAMGALFRVSQGGNGSHPMLLDSGGFFARLFCTRESPASPSLPSPGPNPREGGTCTVPLREGGRLPKQRAAERGQPCVGVFQVPDGRIAPQSFSYGPSSRP